MINIQSLVKTVGVSLLTISLAACATEKAENSGFLTDYSSLKANPEIQGQMRFEDSSISLKAYNQFMIDPIIVHFAPNSEGTAINPTDLKTLTDYFHAAAVQKLSTDFKIANQPGPGVLRLRVAITDISKTIPLLNIHPGTKFSGAGLGGASMEAEAIDSVSSKRIVAVVETAQGLKSSISSGLSEFGHAKEVMDIWVDRFVGNLKKLHGMS